MSANATFLAECARLSVDAPDSTLTAQRPKITLDARLQWAVECIHLAGGHTTFTGKSFVITKNGTRFRARSAASVITLAHTLAGVVRGKGGAA